MQVLHCHWHPPTNPNEMGQVIIWAETGLGTVPRKRKLSKNPKMKSHPFAEPSENLRPLLNDVGLTDKKLASAEIVLQLPTGQYGPHPSPQLRPDWTIVDQSTPILAPWQIKGLSLSVETGHRLLTTLLDHTVLPPGWVLGLDVQYWQQVTMLVLDTLARQKMLPILAQANQMGQHFHARWLPILDEAADGSRLAQCLQAMPPLCRAETKAVSDAVAPRHLLESFMNTMTDALTRQWGRTAFVKQPSPTQDEVAQKWLIALLSDDPGIIATSIQRQQFQRSHRAWLRNLYLAGDRTSRVAFRLEAPLQQQTNGKKETWLLHFALQARDDPSLLVMADQIWQSKAKSLEKLNHRFEQPQEKLLTGLGYAARLFAPFKPSLKKAKPKQLSLTTDEAFHFLREVAPLLEGSGFGVLVPPWWNKPGTKLGIRLKLSSNTGPGADAIPKSRLGFDDLIRYNWEMTVGDITLTREEFEALVALKAPLVQIRGQWVQIDADQIEAAIRFWEKQDMEATLSLQEGLQVGLGSGATIDGLKVTGVEYEGWLADWMERFKGDEKLETLPQPSSLQAQLRPYQQYGYSWLDFMQRWGMGACLADDMGLGKSIQTITLLLAEKEQQGQLQGPVLLVAPTSVVSNWAMEVQRFAPTLITHQHQGPDRLRKKAFIKQAKQVDLILTSFSLIRQDQETLQQIDWYGVVLDEAQNIKNPATKQARAIFQLKTQFRLALTGTPVENRLSELWSIMQFLNPGYLGSRQNFRAAFALPIERYHDEDATQKLRQMTAPFILRRLKSDRSVIQDLPEKNEMKIYYQLSQEQATLYEAVVQDSIEKMTESDGIERQGLVLGMLMKLKQICNHPAQFMHQAGETVRFDSQDDMKRSGKLARITEMLTETMTVGDRSLIFTQFKEMGDILTTHLQQSIGVSPLFLHGGIPAKKRPAMIRRFQEDSDGPPVFILSLKAGGTGLNLTRANHVFHFDRWWNPAVEDQATDRAFRIGQTRQVQVYKFVCLGTLEERIDEMIESKKALADSVVGRGENWVADLSTQELRELVTLRQEVVV
ncbi:MAG: DEAD/DEAH box helicase [Chloroflexota bacterium]